MTTNPYNDVEQQPAPTESGPLSTEDVVDRLEQLWATRPSFLPTTYEGQRIGRYLIDCVLGHGTFGVVYLARDTQHDRDVALKLPRPEVVIDQQKRQRFAQEAAAAAALDHPAIVPIVESQFAGPIPYIASEYCAGPDLGRWLAERETPVPDKEAARFIAQLAGAVQHAHDRGIVHRDLKPSNVLLDINTEAENDTIPQNLGECVPRLTDFGLAKMAQYNQVDTRSSLLIGTPLYMAPEQLYGGSDAGMVPAVDIYALGCLLFELITGRTPIAGETYVEVTDALRKTVPPKLRTLQPAVSRDLETICAKCLEKEPSDRYRTAAALAEDLQRFAVGQPIFARPLGILGSLARWSGRSVRIYQAGYFSVFYNLLVTAWIIVSFPSAHWLGLLEPGQSASLFSDSLIAIGLVLAPKVWLGWQAIQGKVWATWIGPIFASIHLATVISSGLGMNAFYDAFYHGQPAVRWTSHLYLMLLGSFEVAMYLLAFYAHRRARFVRTSHQVGTELES